MGLLVRLAQFREAALRGVTSAPGALRAIAGRSMIKLKIPGSPVALIFQLLLPNHGLLVGKVAGKNWSLGIQVLV